SRRRLQGGPEATRRHVGRTPLRTRISETQAQPRPFATSEEGGPTSARSSNARRTARGGTWCASTGMRIEARLIRPLSYVGEVSRGSKLNGIPQLGACREQPRRSGCGLLHEGPIRYPAPMAAWREAKTGRAGALLVGVALGVLCAVPAC